MLLQLQRHAGNDAVTSFLQRLPTATIAAPAVWTNGPTSKRKSVAHTLEDYVGWVKEVEAGYSGKENVIQRIRRLYYSDYVSTALAAQGQPPGAGSKFDKVIDTSNAGDAPLQSPPISQAALDGLFETDNIITPTGAVVDVSHIWPDLDLAISGKTTKASGVWAVTNADFQGVLTWTGDLASWFLEFVDHVRKKTGSLRMPSASSFGDLDKVLGTDAHKLFMSLAGSKVSKDDLLGDMDAQTIVEAKVTPGRVYGGTPKENASDMLLDYYKPASGPAPEKSRFPSFVRAARPSIPHTFAGSPPSMQLDRHSRFAIFTALTEAAEVLLMGTRGHNVTPVSDIDFVLMEIAQRFTDFLSEGLAKGDAAWP